MSEIDMSDLGAPLEQSAAGVDTSDLAPPTEVFNAPQVTFDEGRGKAYEIPAGMKGHAADHAIGTTFENRSKGDYFGLVDLGKDFAKGLAAGALDTAEIPAQWLISSGEVQKGALTKGGVADGPVFGAESTAPEAPKSIADVQIQMGRALSKAVEGFKAEHDLTPGKPESPFSRLAFSVGSGAGNILTTVGVAALAANSEAAAILTLAYFGTQNAAQGYKKARAFGVGKDPATSTLIGAGEGVLTAAVNGVGFKYLSQGLAMKSGLKKVAAAVVEQSVEEFVDQGSQDIYENMTGVQKISAKEVLTNAVFAAAVGGIVAGPSTIAAHAYVKDRYTKALVDLGIPEEKATAFLDKQTEKTLASPEFHKAAVELAVDQVSEQAMPTPERMENLKQVSQRYDELAAAMDLDLQAAMGADAMKQKISDEMTRIETSIQSKVDKTVRFIEDKQVQGMINEEDKNRADKIKTESAKLISASDAILAKIDALEAQKSELEAQAKKTTAVDTKIKNLMEKHDALDAQLGDLLSEPAGLKDKAKRQRDLNRIDRLARRADAILKEADALQEGQKAVRDLQKKADVKTTNNIEERLAELRQQYDNIDEELSGLIHDQKTLEIPESTFLRLPAKSMEAITARLGKVMEQTREKLTVAYASLEGKVDKAYEKMANRIATTARIAEKRRIHEALRILRQIKTADIEGITIGERRAIQKIQAELKDIKGSPSLKQLHDINDRIQELKDAGKQRLAAIIKMRKELFDTQKAALLLALGVEKTPTKEEWMKAQGSLFYHGTNAADQIEQQGFDISTQSQEGSDFLGDNFVEGVHLSRTKDPYAEGGQLEDVSSVLEVFSSAKNILKTTVGGIGELYQKYGITEGEDGYAQKLTDALKAEGYDGIEYADEVVIFDPSKIKTKAQLEAEYQAKYPKKEPYTGPKPETLDDKLKGAKQAERAAFLHPVRLLEMIDGDNNGIFKDLFFKRVNRNVNVELLQRQEALARLQEILKGNGVSLEELAQNFNIEGLAKPITVSQAMHIYGALGNDLQMLAITKDNGFTPAQVEAIETALADKYKQAARDIVSEFSTHAARLNVALLDYTDGKKDLKLEGPNYIPMSRDNPDNANFNAQQEIEDEATIRDEYRKKKVESGMTEERVNRGEKAKLNPIRLGLVEAYIRHTQAREHYINLARTVKDLNAILSDKDIKSGIIEKHGKITFDTLQDYVNVVATDSVIKAHNAMSASMRKINQIARDGRHAAAFVHLGWNVVSVMKVPVSIMAGLGHVTPVHLMSAIGDMMADQKKTMDFAYARDPQLQAAEFSKEQQEFRDPLKAMQSKDPVGLYRNNAFNWMRALDQWTRVALWTAAYRQKKELRVSEQEAIDFAQELVLRTQPATMNKDLAGIFATNNEILNMITQFTHQVNQNYGILTHDLPRAWQGGRQEQAMGMAIGLVIMALLEYAISTGEMPTDPKDITEGLVQGALYMTPVAGPMINAIHNGFSSTPAAADLFIVKPWKAVEALKAGDFWKTLDNALYFGAAFGKLPYTQLRRTWAGVQDLTTGVTDDYRRLVWSNYQLTRNED